MRCLSFNLRIIFKGVSNSAPITENASNLFKTVTEVFTDRLTATAINIQAPLVISVMVKSHVIRGILLIMNVDIKFLTM